MNESVTFGQFPLDSKSANALRDFQTQNLQLLESVWPYYRLLEEYSTVMESPSKAVGDSLDKSVHAAIAKMTMGISPGSVVEAFSDWYTHLAISPGKQWRLAEKYLNKNIRLFNYAASSAVWCTDGSCVKPLANDNRFSHESWQKWPYNVIHQGFLLTQQWWDKATTDVTGVSKHHEKMVQFGARQLLDTLSPSNNLMTNPEVLQKTFNEGGANLIRGYVNFINDLQRQINGEKPQGSEAFEVGKNLAVTPGKVVYRNELIELLQYTPTTKHVKKEPLLIVPAWIMKYYILDLSQTNSLVKYLVDQGFTVFSISWKNPTSEDRELSMEDYRIKGIERALDAVEAITGSDKIHTMGYCLGGTLLSISAATQARDCKEFERDTLGETTDQVCVKNRIQSMCLLAAQTDFVEAGELTLFIDQSQVSFLEDMMWHQGVLENSQMAGAFQLLRSNDLIWSRLVHEYLMGERAPLNDLMAWNADATRMPYRMHSEYLRKLFLENQLSQGHYTVGGRPISITDIRAPIFAVGTEKDHVAPWHSVYKIHILSDTEVSFVLTSGGHNAGIVSEPGHPRRHYRISKRSADATYLDPDHWLAETPAKEGSWWVEYVSWLNQNSGEAVDPPPMGNAKAGFAVITDAPGTYVFGT
ncbi:alpha/beta fold hydrolase [Sessilibacter sp. MAH1]